MIPIDEGKADGGGVSDPAAEGEGSKDKSDTLVVGEASMPMEVEENRRPAK